MCDFPFETESDRGRIQAEIERLEPMIRRRLRRKLRAMERAAFDLDDLLSSARRRIDLAVLGDRRVPCEGEELAAYAQRVAERVAVDVVRRERRERAIRERVVQVLTPMQGTTSTSRPDMIEAALQHCDDDERAAIELWARGLPHRSIAEALGVSLEAHRSRWRRLLAKLRAHSEGRPPRQSTAGTAATKEAQSRSASAQTVVSLAAC